MHGPGWTETPDDELRAAIEAFMGGGGWVIDSDYRRKLGTLVLERADTVVWLDLPLHVCLRRLWRRTVPAIPALLPTRGCWSEPVAPTR